MHVTSKVMHYLLMYRKISELLFLIISAGCFVFTFIDCSSSVHMLRGIVVCNVQILTKYEHAFTPLARTKTGLVFLKMHANSE